MSDPAPAELSLFHRRGTWVALAAPLASQVVSLGVFAILYRLVAPADFGQIGILAPALLLPRMFVTLGLANATVQAENLSPRARQQLFRLTLVLGIGAAAVTVVASWLLSRAYGIPTLAGVGAALAGTTLFAALANQHQALLERSMVLGPLALARFASQLISGVLAAVIACRGGGVFALIAQQYAELATLAVAVWLLEPWRPWGATSGSPPQPETNRAELAPLLSFGGQVSLSSLLYFLAQNVHAWLMPVLLGNSEAAQAAVGMYTQAFNLMMRPVYLVTSPLSGVLLPALSRAAANREEFARLVRQFFHLAALTLFPAGVGLMIVAPDAMAVLGGERWAAAGWVLAALAPTILTQGIFNLCGSVLTAKGRGRILVVGGMATLLLLAQGLVAGYVVSRGLLATAGDDYPKLMVGMAIGYSLVSVLVLFPPFLGLSLRTTDVPPGETLRPWFKPFWASAVMGLAVWLLREVLASDAAAFLPPSLKLIALIATGAALYATLMWPEFAKATPATPETSPRQTRRP